MSATISKTLPGVEEAAAADGQLHFSGAIRITVGRSENAGGWFREGLHQEPMVVVAWDLVSQVSSFKNLTFPSTSPLP